MYYHFTEKTDLYSFKIALEQMEHNEQISCIAIFSTFKNNIPFTSIQKSIRCCKKQIIGGYFPGIIFNRNVHDQGYLFIGISHLSKISNYIISDISKKTTNELESEITNLQFDNQDINSIFIFVDALSSGINNLVNSFFNIYALDYSYLGGGAGGTNLNSTACLFNNDGIYQDSAMILTLNKESSVGVNHGWETLEGPFVVTQAEGNYILEIEYEPAIDFYKKIIQTHYPEEINNNNFTNIASKFPFGIPKLNSEAIIRDPLQIIDNKYIKCTGPIPPHSTIFIMSANIDNIIQGSINASLDADQENVAPFAMVLDSISRAEFIGEDYGKTLNLIQLRDEKIFGALVIGEIANQKKNYLEYYNNTCVVSRFLI